MDNTYPIFLSCLQLSQRSRSQMELKSLNRGYRGAIIPEHITSQLRYNSIGRKSKDRLNDQLEKMTKIPTLKEHPYSSHISQFAMFPSFRSPDDPDTGVRAASQSFLNLHIPNSASNVTLLSKTIGGPYRHEILETPMKTRKKAVMWPGEHGFLKHTNPLKGESQVFYPTPPKMVLPNPKLREWDLSLPEQTSNMLINLERTHWLTSYQMNYTGSGPANPLQIDDFKEKMSDLAGINLHTTPLRERSYPVFIPSKPKQECRRRQWSLARRTICSPTAAELLNPSLAPNEDTASATICQQRPQKITAKHNEAPDLNPKSQSEAESAALSQEVLQKQQTEHSRSLTEGREKENCKVQFNESPLQVFMKTHGSQEANAALIRDTKQLLYPNKRPLSQGATDVNREESLIKQSKEQHFKASPTQSAVAKDQAGPDSPTGLLSRAASKLEKQAEGKGMTPSTSNSYILSRPPVLAGIHPVDRAGTVATEGAALSLLDLQNAFNKSEAHRKFNSNITRAAVNLRDNVVTGKRHNFHGINCYYLHG
nr:uncharacterized protein C7orf31 homolog isoform X2 [Monopterus albus]